MPDGKPETVRKTITLSKATLRHLEKLAKKGLHGSGWSGVAQGFVEKGVRKAIRQGFIEDE